MNVVSLSSERPQIASWTGPVPTWLSTLGVPAR